MSCNPPVQHHYVPRFYLKAWAGADGQLFRCHRVPHTGLLHHQRVTPAQVARQAHLNTHEAEHPALAPDFFIETRFFGELDSAAAKVFAEMREFPRRIPNLNRERRRVWARFLSSLVARNPSWLQQQHGIAAHVVQQSLEVFPRLAASAKSWRRMSLFAGLIDRDASVRNFARKRMLAEIDDPTRLDLIQSLDWKIVSLRQPMFVTSDRPILCGVDGIPAGKRGIILPLSPRLTFVATDNADHHELAVDHPWLLYGVDPTAIFSHQRLTEPQLALAEAYLSRYSAFAEDFLRDRVATE